MNYLVVIFNHGHGHRFVHKEPGQELRICGDLREATLFTEEKAYLISAGLNPVCLCCVKDLDEYKMEVAANAAEVKRLLSFLPVEVASWQQ